MVDRLRRSEANRQRILKVEEYFGGHGQRFSASEDRVLVGEGVLVKLCRKKPKPRQFYLFNDLLVYGSILTKHRFIKQHVIPLETVKLENLVDTGDAKNGWMVKTPTKSFRVYAATPGEKQEWTQHIERCVRELINEGRQPAVEHAPAWAPDDTAKVCQCCQSSHFTVVNRRHHCRKCGRVVCGGCSQRSFLLLNIHDEKPQRVCDTCYNRLCNGMTAPVPGSGDASSSEHGGKAEAVQQTSPHKMVTLASGANIAMGDSGDSSDASEEEDDPSRKVVHEEYEAPTFYGSLPPAVGGAGASTSMTISVAPISGKSQSQHEPPTTTDF